MLRRSLGRFANMHIGAALIGTSLLVDRKPETQCFKKGIALPDFNKCTRQKYIEQKKVERDAHQKRIMAYESSWASFKHFVHTDQLEVDTLTENCVAMKPVKIGDLLLKVERKRVDGDEYSVRYEKKGDIASVKLFVDTVTYSLSDLNKYLIELYESSTSSMQPKKDLYNDILNKTCEPHYHSGGTCSSYA